MSNRIEEMTGRVVDEGRFSLPEVVHAKNGYIVRQYDPKTDALWYLIASTPDEVRSILNEWVQTISESLVRVADRKIAALIAK